MTNIRLKGKKKVAILLTALGPEKASEVLKHFSEQEMEQITMEIANLEKVDKETQEKVMEEFQVMNQTQHYILEGGTDYAKEVLEKAMGPQKASEMIKRLKEQTMVKPFSFARNADPNQLVNMLSSEHPQVVSLILSYLDSQQSASVLAELPGEMQSDIARRIAKMERVSPEVLDSVESTLQEKLTTVFQQDFTQAGGIDSIVQILNSVDRGTEKLILEELEKEDPELADEIRQRMFIFEDVVTLDDASIQRIVREVENNDLAKALKGATEEVKERIFRNISKRAAEMLQEELDFMGPVRLREVEDAQQKIVSAIRRLDEAGEIIISRGGEDTIIT